MNKKRVFIFLIVLIICSLFVQSVWSPQVTKERVVNIPPLANLKQENILTSSGDLNVFIKYEVIGWDYNDNEKNRIPIPENAINIKYSDTTGDIKDSDESNSLLYRPSNNLSENEKYTLNIEYTIPYAANKIDNQWIYDVSIDTSAYDFVEKPDKYITSISLPQASFSDIKAFIFKYNINKLTMYPDTFENTYSGVILNWYSDDPQEINSTIYYTESLNYLTLILFFLLIIGIIGGRK